MDLHAPFTGTLLLPDRALPGTSPVQLADGPVVAYIQRPFFAFGGTFHVLDASRNRVATGRRSGWLRKRKMLRAPDGSTLLELRLGWLGTTGRSAVTLASGRQLATKGHWLESRRFVLLDGEQEIGGIAPTTHSFSVHRDSYAFELYQPLLSIVQAAGLAQCLRAAVKAARSQQRNSHRNRRRGGVGGSPSGLGGGSVLGDLLHSRGRSGRSDRAGRSGSANQSGASGRSDRAGQAGSSGRSARSGKSGLPKRSGKSGKSGRSGGRSRRR